MKQKKQNNSKSVMEAQGLQDPRQNISQPKSLGNTTVMM